MVILPMPVLTAKGLERFTPESGNAVYLIRIPTLGLKASFRRHCVAAGIQIWPKRELCRRAAITLREANPDNLDSLLDLVAEVEAAAEDGADLGEATLTAWTGLSQELRRFDPGFAGLVADNQHWTQLAPIIAARFFLAGWEGIDLAFKRGIDGLVPEDLLELLPEADLTAIGWRALQLMTPTGAQEKNSDLPPPSPPDLRNSGPKNSGLKSSATVAPDLNLVAQQMVGPPMVARPMGDLDGSSSANATPPIPA